jgi:hypothetical protein
MLAHADDRNTSMALSQTQLTGHMTRNIRLVDAVTRLTQVKMGTSEHIPALCKATGIIWHTRSARGKRSSYGKHCALLPLLTDTPLHCQGAGPWPLHVHIFMPQPGVRTTLTVTMPTA